jgi:hypothetical protein
MSSFPKLTGAALAAGAALLLVAGCETGRTNKQHNEAMVLSDVSTTGKQDPAFTADGKGQPPVPGSPTAAGRNGKQPYDDTQARAGSGAEEGVAPPPGKQLKDPFQRQ